MKGKIDWWWIARIFMFIGSIGLLAIAMGCDNPASSGVKIVDDEISITVAEDPAYIGSWSRPGNVVTFRMDGTFCFYEPFDMSEKQKGIYDQRSNILYLEATDGAEATYYWSVEERVNSEGDKADVMTWDSGYGDFDWDWYGDVIDE